MPDMCDIVEILSSEYSSLQCTMLDVCLPSRQVGYRSCTYGTGYGYLIGNAVNKAYRVSKRSASILSEVDWKQLARIP